MYCMLISSLILIIMCFILLLFYYYFIIILCVVLHETEHSVLAPELLRGWNGEPRSPRRSLAGRPMTRRRQRPTGQRSRRLNSKTLMPTPWPQSRPVIVKKRQNSSTPTLLILLLWVSCSGEACWSRLNQTRSCGWRHNLWPARFHTEFWVPTWKIKLLPLSQK